MDEKIKNIINSTELKKRDDETEYYAITDNCEKTLKDLYLKMIYEDNVGGKQDLSYQIINEATIFFDELDEEKASLKTISEQLDEYQDFATTRNVEQLEMLNNYNEHEIADILKDYSCKNISTACAIWYENQVKQVIGEIIDTYLTE